MSFLPVAASLATRGMRLRLLLSHVLTRYFSYFTLLGDESHRVYSPGCTHSQNPWYPPSPVPEPEVRRRAPPGVRRGHPAGRPGTTRRLLSALRGVLLPFAHGFREKHQRLFDGVSWKVGRPRALVACCVSKNWTENICAFSGLESSQQPEVITAERPKL